MPALSPTVLSVVGSSGSLNERVIMGNAVLLIVLERRCICLEGPAAPGPSDSSSACRDAEEDADSVESRGDTCPDEDMAFEKSDSEVRACS